MYTDLCINFRKQDKNGPHKLRDLLMMIFAFQSEQKLEVYVENQSW